MEMEFARIALVPQKETNPVVAICKSCERTKLKDQFSKNQRKKHQNNRTCMDCTIRVESSSLRMEDELRFGNREVWAGMTRLSYESNYSHCADIGFYGDPDLWDIMAGCSGD